MPFDGFHPLNLIVILVIALLIFGPKKLPEMGKAIGQSIQMFRKGMNELTNPKAEDTVEETQLPAKTPEALRQELEELEREIANRKAMLAEQEIITPEAPAAQPELVYTEETPTPEDTTFTDEVNSAYEATTPETEGYTTPEPATPRAEVHPTEQSHTEEKVITKAD